MKKEPLYKSRRFWLSVAGGSGMIISAFIPELEEHINIIVPGIVGIIGVLVGGLSIEDAARARNGNNGQ